LVKDLNIPQLFEQFAKMNVLIIGDVMIDSYMFGNVDRISPEAPVPIVSITGKEDRLGGAANVAINIRSLGACPYLCSVIGNDQQGNLLLQLMNDLSLPPDGIVKDKGRMTTVKTRVIGNKHQLLRVDEEQTDEISASATTALVSAVKKLIATQEIHVIIIEDYDKGVLHPQLIDEITRLAVQEKIPIAVDPKKRNFISYAGVTLFKPNLAELKTGLKTDIDRLSKESLDATAGKYRVDKGFGRIMVTLSEAGVYIADKDGSVIIPAHLRNISDVSGAGDTVISVAALCLAAGISSEEIAVLANLAGGLVCEKIGVVPVDKDQLMEEAMLMSNQIGSIHIP
jgi:rfaE bifunctional protein kinase chain/domain